MKNEKRKLVLSAACLAVVVVLNQLIAWAFPNLMRTSPLVAALVFVSLFIPMAVSMSYLTGTMMCFLMERLLEIEERQKALHLPLKQRIGRNLLVWLTLACGFGLLVGSYNLPTLGVV